MHSRKWLATVLILATILLAQSAAAQLYTMSIPPTAFNPYDNDIGFRRHPGALQLYPPGSASGRFFAPLSLPHGAVIKDVSASLYHGLSDQNISLSLSRYPGNGSNGQTIVHLSTTSSEYGMVTLNGTASQSLATVDNANYSYSLSVSLPQETTAQILYKAIITFEAHPGVVVVPLF